jgi:hypothetical protein
MRRRSVARRVSNRNWLRPDIRREPPDEIRRFAFVISPVRNTRSAICARAPTLPRQESVPLRQTRPVRFACGLRRCAPVEFPLGYHQPNSRLGALLTQRGSPKVTPKHPDRVSRPPSSPQYKRPSHARQSGNGRVKLSQSAPAASPPSPSARFTAMKSAASTRAATLFGSSN